ncbi:DUF1877 family protein [Streptomyces sp. NPDC005423]|uniref:DUF1877 family protein n=1 Tax=Streptomyces sp. NPDC005423 TaxID=3155343 RepID=UPI0033ADCFFE
MSVHLHFRAAPAEAIVEDHAWLTRFMLAAWERHSEEFDAGIATSINKDFDHVHLLYTGASEGACGEPDSLPIEGGHVVRDPTDANPPFLILGPAQVRATAAFLRTVSFDTRWNVGVPELSSAIPAWNEARERNLYRDYHHDLRDFYQTAASADKR